MKCVYLALLLMLTGCMEDKGALVSQCQLDYQNNHKLNADGVAQSVLLCMRIQGFNFESRYATAVDQMSHRPNTKCYEITMIDKEAYATNPFYNSPTCYYRVSFLAKITGEE